MRIASINPDSFANSITGLTVEVWTGGCSIHCKGCHNQEMWDPEKFPEVDDMMVVQSVLQLINKNLMHDLSILGGEPLAPWNIDGVATLVKYARKAYPDMNIYLWTGYKYEDLIKGEKNDNILTILGGVTYLIDGPYVEELRDTSLTLRGSSNQHVRKMNGNFLEIIDDKI